MPLKFTGVPSRLTGSEIHFYTRLIEQYLRENPDQLDPDILSFFVPAFLQSRQMQIRAAEMLDEQFLLTDLDARNLQKLVPAVVEQLLESDWMEETDE